jgi:hypothetical protein
MVRESIYDREEVLECRAAPRAMQAACASHVYLLPMTDPELAAQLPISDYGLIGDMRTAALVGLNGAIDWCCLPRFDSGSVFAALLDPERGGTWAVRPAVPWTSTQRYLPRTNILETTFRTPDDGIVTLTDFMPVDEDGRPSGTHPEIHRHVRGVRGTVPMEMVFAPRFEYGARGTRVEQLKAGLFATDRTDQVLTLSSARPFDWSLAGGRPPPGFRSSAASPAGWCSASTTTTSIRSIATRAPANSTSPPPSGSAGPRPCATAGRTGRWFAAPPSRSSC